MEISKFIKIFMPTMERANLRNTLTSVQEEFSRHNKPIFKDAAAKFGGFKFKSEWNTSFEKELEKASKTKARGNSIAVVNEINKTLNESFDLVQRLLDDYFGEDFSRDSITIPRYNLIQYIEALSFFVTYSSRWLHTTLKKEQAIVESLQENEYNTPSELHYLNVNRAAFLAVVNIITTNGHKVDKIVEVMDDVVITEDNVDFQTAAGNGTKVDPMGFGFIDTRLNPFFYGRMAMYKWQVKHLKSAQLRADALQLRIIALRTALDGKPDAQKAALAKQLEEKRLKPLMMEIAELEEEING